MRMANQTLLLAALLLATISTAQAQTPDREDAVAQADGRLYAQENCAVCHAIGAMPAPSPNPAAPNFRVIASTPGMTAIALNAILHSPHRSMPNLIVAPAAINDLAAYMRSLRDPALTRQLRKKANEPPILRPLAK